MPLFEVGTSSPEAARSPGMEKAPGGTRPGNARSRIRVTYRLLIPISQLKCHF
jgi:hypothetical protein